MVWRGPNAIFRIRCRLDNRFPEDFLFSRILAPLWTIMKLLPRIALFSALFLVSTTLIYIGYHQYNYSLEGGGGGGAPVRVVHAGSKSTPNPPNSLYDKTPLNSSSKSSVLSTLPNLVVPKPKNRKLKVSSSLADRRRFKSAVPVPAAVPVPVPATVTVPNNIPMEYLASSWKPLIITECYSVLPKSAPCIQKHLTDSNPSKNNNLIQSQELLFPQIQMRIPSFAREEHKSQWLQMAANIDRFVVKQDWAVYYEFHGQNMVFRDAVYRGDPPADVWSNNGCMASGVSHESFLSSSSSSSSSHEDLKEVDVLVVAASPDSWSFQHFLDRVTIIMTQAQLILNGSPSDSGFSVVSGRQPNFRFANDYYKALGAKEHFHSRGGIRAKKLVFSCRAPLIHPYSTKMTSEQLGLFRNGLVPLSDRKVVYYLSRSTGLERNGGRQVSEEAVFIKRLQSLLDQRGQGERLEVFDPRSFETLESMVSTISRNARAIIGPHGGAHYNGRFAFPETLIVEFIPSNRFEIMFFEQARNLHQKYAAIMVDGSNDSSNLQVNFDDLKVILDKELGLPMTEAPIMQTPYGWNF